MTKVLSAVLTVTVLLTVTGCRLASLAPPPSTPTTPTNVSTTVPNPLEATSGTAPPAERDPAIAAQRFLLTWARPELPYRDWWSGVAPLMNPEGRQDYATTDPANLPLLTLTAAPSVQPSAVATSVAVWQPTSLGRFGVRLTRSSLTAGWLVAELTFPAGVH